MLHAPKILPRADFCGPQGRKKRQETSGSGGGAKASGTPSPVVGEWRGVRTVAQQQEGDEHSGIESR